MSFNLKYGCARESMFYIKNVNTHCSHCTLLHVSVLKGQSSGSTDTFCEQGQQNACPDVNIILESSVLYGTWQLDSCVLYVT